MSGPRVLLTADAVGGVWTYALDLARALRPLGVEPVLAVLGPSPSAAQVREADGIALIDTGLPLDWLAPDEASVRAASRALAEVAREQQADLIQINQPALAAEPMPAPVIAVVHSCVSTWWAAVEQGPLPRDFAWQTALVRAGLARASATVCPSAAFAQAVRTAYLLPVAPRVVYNGRQAAAMPSKPMLDHVFTAGRLWDRGKDAATLDRAAARLNVPVLAAGTVTGPNGEGVVLANVRALGSLSAEEVAERLAERPVFVSTAQYEPFGLAVLEAAQAGCALVLSDIPTFRELWDGAATFVAPDDDAGFAEAITALIGDQAERPAAGERARQRAGRFTPEAMAVGMAGIYGDALGGRAAA